LNLFEITLRLSGFDIKGAKKKLSNIQRVPESEFQDYVINQRRSIVEYHLLNNPLYRSLVGSDRFEKWEQLPVMKKSDLQQPLKQRLSDTFNLKNVYVNKTSGSSGHPFIFAKDRFCHALTWAEIIDRFGWYDIDFNSTLQARFYGIPLDFWGYYKERMKDRLSRRYRFPIFDLSEKKLEYYLSVFKKKHFYYINGYTSSVVLFAKYLKSKNIVLNAVCPTLKYCLVTSEMLYESDKLLLENYLGVPVVNEYGAAEMDLIAFTNKKGEFIVNSETLFLEILDDNNMPVEPGRSGRIIITSLYNKANPMIRYDIGDTGTLSEKSTLKKPILTELTGRTNDVAKLPSGKVVPGLTFYYVTKSIIEDSGIVKEFIIEQTARDSFNIIYVSERELTQNETEEIKRTLFTYVENGLQLNFKRESVLNRGQSGKLKQFISYL
jgi:phenylacetate-CoA ligase